MAVCAKTTSTLQVLLATGKVLREIHGVLHTQTVNVNCARSLAMELLRLENARSSETDVTSVALPAPRANCCQWLYRYNKIGCMCRCCHDTGRAAVNRKRESQNQTNHVELIASSGDRGS